MWPYDEFEMDFGGETGGQDQAGLNPLQTVLYDPSGSTFGNPSGADISGGQMLPLDYTNTVPENNTVTASNNIQGQMPAFLNSVNNIISTFGNAYAKVNAANVQTAANRVVPPSAIPLQPPVQGSSFFEQNKGILIPIGLVALVYFLA